MIDITIAIVNWNTGVLLDDCLDSVRATRGNLALQTIVFDNGSSDGSAIRAQAKHPWAEFIFNQGNPGFSTANNQALARATGRYFLLLNPDTVLRLGALTRLLEFMDADPAAGAAGPRLEYPDGSLQVSWSGRLVSPCSILADILGWRMFGADPLAGKAPEVPIRVQGLMGACIMLRKGVIDQIGPMDERFFLVYEEADWCCRVLRASKDIWYVPDAAVVHHAGGSSQYIPGKGLIETQHSLKYYIAKHYGVVTSAAMVAALVIIYGWWLMKTHVKRALLGLDEVTALRLERFRYILRGLLTSRK